MRHLSKREKTIFYICIIIASIYAGYNWIYKPMKNQAEILSQVIAERGGEMLGAFTVVTPGLLRIRKTLPPQDRPRS